MSPALLTALITRSGTASMQDYTATLAPLLKSVYIISMVETSRCPMAV